SKGIQGVDNPEKLKQKPPTPASLTLAWRRPKHAEETIPQRDLLPVSLPEAFVVSSPFPADDRSLGQERGTSIPTEWDQATTSAALDTAGYVASHLRDLAGVPDDAPDREKQARVFCGKFVERAFRRPLSADQQQFFVERQFLSGPDIETKVKRVVLLA